VENGPARKKQMHEIRRVKNAAIAVRKGVIIEAGPADDVLSKIETDAATRKIEAPNKLVTPGLIDPHTHLVFGGNRANEFLMRCQGKTYAEIASSGGGIVASMRATRNATVDELVETGLYRLKRMLAHGTTTCEVKTGYGLTQDSELRMLEAIYELARVQPIELVPTFMPAHAFPPEVDRKQYVNDIVAHMLPAAALFACSSSAKPCVDVFCDEGYFSLDDTRRIFDAALSLKMKLKVHADEFANLKATELACEYGALSADHLLKVSDKEIKMLAQSDTVAVLLPGTSFYLNLSDHAPARKLIEDGAAVALGSDFNPGSCHIFSLPFIWGLGCLKLKLTVEEALTALTHNAAFAIGRGGTVGQLLSGYQADITIYDVPALEEGPYNLGWNPVAITIKKGEIGHRRVSNGRQIDGANNFFSFSLYLLSPLVIILWAPPQTGARSPNRYIQARGPDLQK